MSWWQPLEGEMKRLEQLPQKDIGELKKPKEAVVAEPRKNGWDVGAALGPL